MHAHHLIIAVFAVVLSRATAAIAQEEFGPRWKGEASFAVSYLLAGGSSYRGGRAPATGGAALVPTGRLLYTMPVADLYAAGSPIVVTPWTLSSTGIVGAVDIGASWHPDSRLWTIGTGGTLAPAYMRFCNQAWCLKEGLLLYGAEAHVGGRFLQQQNGAGLSGTLSARALTGRPTAWFWPSLTREQAKINHVSAIIGCGLTWIFL